MLLLAVRAVMMLAKNRMWYVTVRNKLNRAVVVAELLLGDDIRVVAMHVAVDAHNATHNTRYGAYIVRDHNDGHLLGEVVEKVVKFVLELIVYKVRRLV